MNKKSIAVLLGFLFFTGTVNAQSMQIEWGNQKEQKRRAAHTIHVGKESRKYTGENEYDSAVSFVNISELKLAPDAANYITATKKGFGGYSNEIVIFWSGSGINSDKDGLPDALEKRLGTNPFDEDTDGDGIWDDEEYATWGSKRSLVDYDEDGLINLRDPDSDNDGILDGQDSDIRRLSSFFRISEEFITGGGDPFLYLYEKPKPKKERAGNGTIQLKWPAKLGGKDATYRIYVKRGDESDYDFGQWDVETKRTNTVIGGLERNVEYNFLIRVFDSSGNATDVSREATAVPARWKEATYNHSFNIFGSGISVKVKQKTGDPKSFRLSSKKPGNLEDPSLIRNHTKVTPGEGERRVSGRVIKPGTPIDVKQSPNSMNEFGKQALEMQKLAEEERDRLIKKYGEE